MTRDRALAFARSLLAPAGALGYYTGRGTCWGEGERLANYKRATARVMGECYFLLRPIWIEYPDLDPGKEKDPLGLGERAIPLQVSHPSHLLETLAELRDATARAIPELGGEARNGPSLLAAIDVASAAFTDASEPV